MRKITKKGMKRKADKLFSLKVRSKGYCELKGKDSITCGGPLQCAHIDTRGKHAIRWNEMNALCICAGHHIWYTNNPKMWDYIIREDFSDKYEFVEEHQSDIWDKDIEKVLEDLIK